jgi:hypothetical protein
MAANKSNIFSCSDNLNTKTLTQYKDTSYYVSLSAPSQQAETNNNSLVWYEPSVVILSSKHMSNKITCFFFFQVIHLCCVLVSQ